MHQDSDDVPLRIGFQSRDELPHGDSSPVAVAAFGYLEHLSGLPLESLRRSISTTHEQWRACSSTPPSARRRYCLRWTIGVPEDV